MCEKLIARLCRTKYLKNAEVKNNLIEEDTLISSVKRIYAEQLKCIHAKNSFC